MTPRSSSSGMERKRPSVAHTTAWRGLRPVAKALGCSLGEMATRGIGIPARVANSFTIPKKRGASSSVTMRALALFRASLSLNQYEPPTMTKAMRRPKVRELELPPPKTPAMVTMRPPSPARRTDVLMVFLNMGISFRRVLANQHENFVESLSLPNWATGPGTSDCSLPP